jgi:hypothetical protein
MKNEGADNSNTNQPNHGPSRHHGDIGTSTELEHVRGTINNDEYAVINRNILHHQHHPPTTTVINREIVYITPTPEYDRLNHSDKSTLQLDNGVNDRNTQNYTVIILLCSMYVSQRVWWKRDMVMSPWTEGLVEVGYDHVPMDRGCGGKGI